MRIYKIEAKIQKIMDKLYDALVECSYSEVQSEDLVHNFERRIAEEVKA